jgi:acyl-CoA dehydrogenase
MTAILPLIAALIASGICAYLRVGLRAWTIATAAAIVLVGLLAHAPVALVVTLIVFALVAVPLNLDELRRTRISAPLLDMFAKVTPKLSDTEQTALEAGTVGFEGELFSGMPDWAQLLQQPVPALSADEQAFMDGPVEELCAMIDDWQITHEIARFVATLEHAGRAAACA